MLCQPSDETLSFYRDTIIIRLKNSLGFNRHAIGKKHITIDAFPESVFLFLFENEDNFKYISSQRKYQCIFEGSMGAEKLKSIFKYNEIIFRENINTSTRGYILFEDNDSQYKATFSWKQKEWKENNELFLTGAMLINFITNSGDQDQENIAPPLYEPTFDSKHNLHTIYNNSCNVSSSHPNFSQSNNTISSINIEPTTITKSRYRYILPRPPII
ncbi:hypothetical protein GLOIN_2v1761336 [Rhizophagus irregularis DAOM 181602=DAOM 197198]|uniref:Uncharacterized protein n=1 Tax=Rhizophagus irregularis (strain DAOM 181602 / DAOM 197198 / MUCL 43194) TaxID=747089 RepID=A0A2P4R0B2_RHIID|nr:hypothetical protein GLOIN_2v1761336 [Rhizophagus irregularis DAOM 181602=DAOM 197198]POG83295.1 hypothetical protein GLOIN_2v1761336 [Rhizophagus irregularis DAOM 181602=DAOM 197198]|eukprot:XP_025190161.1 hypothetical protein GLOIN_2v1761336 [Rhizophagus irregularis DAOM 181602=DAOM 197198]